MPPLHTISASKLLEDARCYVHQHPGVPPATPASEFKHSPVLREVVWPQPGTAPHFASSKQVR